MNILKKLLVVFVVALMGASPLAAMKRSPVDDLNEQFKNVRLEDNTAIDWQEIERLMAEDVDFDTIAEKYCPFMSSESNDFEDLFVMALHYNDVGLDDTIKPILDAIDVYGPDALKYIIHLYEKDQRERFKQQLKSGALFVVPQHLVCAILLKDKYLLDLLLRYTEFGFDEFFYQEQSFCELIVRRVAEEEGLYAMLGCFLNYCYEPTYEDIYASLEMENFKVFSDLLSCVSNDNFTSVFSAPTCYGGCENLLCEVLDRGLDERYVELLFRRHPMPQGVFEAMVKSISADFCMPDGHLGDEGVKIIAMLGKALELSKCSIKKQ